MTQQYVDHWLEEVVKQIENRNPQKIVLSTGKTPSGHIHLGILRELVICDSLRRIFEQKGKKLEFRLFFDSLDAAKRFPNYIPENIAKNELGKPFALIPPPFNDFPGNNYAEYFGNELIASFKELGIKVEVVWTHELYKTEKMQNQIRIGLQNVEKVREIVLKYITATVEDEKSDEIEKNYQTWMPAMVICEKCQRTQKKTQDGIKPNRVISYNKDTDEVYYECYYCGFKGSTKIKDGLVKLNWRLDWPAKWDLFKTTLEPAGKDHTTKGGSYDTGLELSREIYKYEGPIPLGYEWIRLGDQDMKTSAGIQMTPLTYLSMCEPEIIRMLILKTNPERHIAFRVEDIPLYYDEYERIERVYYGLEEEPNEALKKEILYYYPLTKPNGPSKSCPPQISFKFLIIMTQLENLLTIDQIKQKAQKMQTTKKIKEKISTEYIKRRLKQVKNWLDYLKKMIDDEKDSKTQKILRSKADFFEIPDKITDKIKNQLDETQKKFLHIIKDWLNTIDEVTEENLKEIMITSKDKLNAQTNKLFQAMYLILIGANQGPRLGSFMSLLEMEWLKNRFNEF